MSAATAVSTPSRGGHRAVPRRSSLVAHGVLMLAIYPALLLTQRGQVAADSKPLLFIDSGRFFSRVAYLWDPTAGLGTVTHQNIGYVLPMGPWFSLTEQLGIPVWLSQRLWLATVLFAAGAGVLFLARTLKWRGTLGPTIAALAFALSPFVVQYATHLSVLLLPFAGLPWLVALTLRATRDGGWRWPACFALVVALVGTINATALACVLLGPVVVWVAELARSWPDHRRAVGAALRIVGLSAAVSLWWVVALLIESRYAINVVDSSESLETVTMASSTPEVLRGLGYWFLYGRDSIAPYLDGGRTYMVTWVLPISFVPMLLAAVAAVTTRWRRRGTFVALLAVGTVLAIGAHAYDSPSPFGAAFRSTLESVDVARALRSISRVTPLIVLAIAVLLGMGVTAVRGRSRGAGRVAAGVAGIAVVLAIAPLWTGDLVSGTRTRPEAIPAAWNNATAALDRAGNATRVLELPGIDFAAYDWGYTNDSITRALMDRPTVAREVAPYGTAASVDLVNAFDRRIQEGTFDAAALPGIARLVAASSVLVRGDLQLDRYDLPDIQQLRDTLDPLPEGITRSKSFGKHATPDLSILEVEGSRQIVRAEPAARPVLVSGSGEGLVDAAEAGVLPDNRLVVYTGSLAGRPATVRRLLEDNAEFVVTDSNRKRAVRAKTLYNNNGYTERVDETPLRADLEDARLELFSDAGDDARTVALAPGATARATSYGNPLTLEPSQRPMLAIDGDPTTAWRTGDFWRVLGERLEITVRPPVEADHITLLQPADGNRHITRVRLTFDGGSPIDADLGPASRVAPGQTIRFPPQTFEHLGIEVLATDPDERANNGGLSGVGLAEVSIPGVAPATELVRLPTDVLALAAAASDEHALTYLISRLRASSAEAPERAAELTLARKLVVPTNRAFAVSGDARAVADAMIEPGACRSDLLTLDATALPVRIGDIVPGTDGRRPIMTCDGSALDLAAGRHVLRSSDGRATGIAIDRLVLRSVAGGGAAPETTTDELRVPTPRLRVDRMSPTSMTIDVRGARRPFWLVLGESYSDGWKATREGSDLGAPTLVDGYANGWYIDPGRTSTFTVDVRWTPQRWVWLSLAFSAAAILACLVMAFWRRRRGLVAAPDEGPTTPLLLWPTTSIGATPSGRAIAATGIICTVVAAVLAGTIGGLVVGATTIAALRLRRGRAALAIAALLALGGSAVFVVAREVSERFPADFPWPASFDAVHTVALVGILLLAADVVVEWQRTRAARAAVDGPDIAEEPRA